ncbi:isoleucine--tRNA ligase [Desulfurobacterium atlanticum]|uniref:Isoleucine--tRNA ligase n=1 Tax=Desulfurobacterium atlanticum TaxID=240169 RepID=A0A238YRV3_9BACT|nr:isoleucine--tRNA ligase [Desulfurobacterium atlanticum]SNR73421.1 Isoleucyl-tRNA synthetase [Desulfurobacterium atlanticum]
MPDEKKDYKETLNLPKTSFPMRGNLPKKETEILKFWKDIGIYEKVLKKREGNEKYVLHDGPPYANGHIHIGHALNKILKDLIVKSRAMAGYYTPYVPGWDCHGLPIERAVFQKIKKRKEEVDPVEIRKRCREYAKQWINTQREEFIRLGVLGDWENPYITMTPQYQADILRELAKFYGKDLVYRAKKPVYWCPNCTTALAEAEIEYKDKTSTSIYVKFKIEDEKFPENSYFVIWTTTPWTLPANVAVVLHPDLEYQLLTDGTENYLITTNLVDSFKEKIGKELKSIKTFKGSELEGIRYSHPFIDREGVSILADFVSDDTGTGIVHSAPGHGEEDYIVSRKYNLPVLAPVDDYGRFTNEAPEWLQGIKIWQANEIIVKRLKETGYLLHTEEITHSYPHCWRCKKPVIFRATPQWFIALDKGNPTLREIALSEIKKVKWIPEWGEIRISNMVEQRPDWCISRQRIWGVPIVAFYCEKCGKLIASQEIAEHVADIFEKESADSWYEKPANELLPDGFKCPECGGTEFKKEMDILDVWFDSGSSHAAVLERRKELKWPADMYLEGSDQHRGWFQASLLESCGTRGKAPYRSVLTHGFTLDQQGRKMSKSLGNVISPQDIIKQFGADILRLWVSSENFSEDVRISKDILKQIADVYRKIRNTIRFILGNLNDFNPETDTVPFKEMEEIDRWALTRLSQIKKEILKFYEEFKYNRIYRVIYNYCATELSATYLDILKDTLYCELPDSKKRRSAQTAIYTILRELTKLLAPILSFTMEEVYSHIPGDKEESVFLENFESEIPEEKELLPVWKKLIDVKKAVNKACETARTEKLIGHSLEAAVKVYADGEIFDLLKKYESQLPYIFITSKAEVLALKEAPAEAVSDEEIEKLKVLVEKAPGKKCERCWMFSEDVGKDSEYPDVCPRCKEVLKKLGE